MAFDGIVISCLAWELNERLIDGRINKIYQPETDALVLTIKNNRHNYRLLLSASPSLPLAYITEDSGTNPMVAPNFCMLLRKHISGGRIAAITQPDMERILKFEIEHLNELGDLCTKFLIVELMGKHSNIIFCQPDGTIIDSIKHISLNVSSVREVLPGAQLFRTEYNAQIKSSDRGFGNLYAYGSFKAPLHCQSAVYKPDRTEPADQ